MKRVSERGDGVPLSQWMNAGQQTTRTVSPHPRGDDVDAWRVLLRELGDPLEPLDAVHETFGMYGQVVLQVLLALQDCEMDDDHNLREEALFCERLQPFAHAGAGTDYIKVRERVSVADGDESGGSAKRRRIVTGGVIKDLLEQLVGQSTDASRARHAVKDV